MSAELLIAIALLCQAPGGYSGGSYIIFTHGDVEQAQLSCQRRLRDCVKKQSNTKNKAEALADCI